jgi:hypothetical protein
MLMQIADGSLEKLGDDTLPGVNGKRPKRSQRRARLSKATSKASRIVARNSDSPIRPQFKPRPTRSLPR